MEFWYMSHLGLVFEIGISVFVVIRNCEVRRDDGCMNKAL